MNWGRIRPNLAGMEKKWKDRIRAVVLYSGCLAMGPVTCNSIFEKPKPVTADEEYDEVMTTASMVPQRFKKGTRPVTISPLDVMSAGEFENAAQRGTSVGKVPGAAGK